VAKLKRSLPLAHIPRRRLAEAQEHLGSSPELTEALYRLNLALAPCRHYFRPMCGRIIQSSAPLRLAIVEGLNVGDSRMGNVRPRYNAAPSQELLVIRQNHKTGERSLDLVRWGLIPYSCSDPRGGRKPINAKAESVSRLPTFRDAYARRRCIVPVAGFFEWRAVRGARAKQPYAIAMRDGSPFGLAGLWENWRNPRTGEWERSFAIITVPSNALVGKIHHRMPAILDPATYGRWLGSEPDPRDLLLSYPSQPMAMWPISSRVNSPDNDDPSLLNRAADAFDVWAPLSKQAST
jgi:putative SOS response-associated peptidase YedK